MSPPRVDLDLATEFLDRLADRRGAPFTFQTFDDDRLRDDGAFAHVLNGTLEECAHKLLKLNEAGAGVFVTVNETDLRGRKTSNVVGLRALFVDKDDGAPGAFPVEPSLIVGREEAPQRWHGYWYLRAGEPLDLFGPAQRALIAHYRSDPLHDLPRVLRVAGFLHRKSMPEVVRILWRGPIRRFSIEEVMCAHGAWPLDLEPLPAGPPADSRPSVNGGRPSRLLERALLSAVAPRAGRPGNRNGTCFWLSCQLRDIGLREGDARAIIDAFVRRAPAGEHPFGAREALRTLASAYSRRPRQRPARPAASAGRTPAPGRQP